MSTYTDLLPPAKSHPRGTGYKWTPSEDNHGCGLLRIESKVCVTYLVVEFANQFAGRSWHLAKVDQGSDKESESYDCFIASNRRDRSCTCKGWSFGKNRDDKGRATCKHLESLLSILENRWDGCPVNDHADTGSTERYEMPETI